MKKIFALLLCFFMCTSYVSASLVTFFTNNGGDHLWQNVNNWDVNGIPREDTGDIAYIAKTGGVDCNINPSTTAVCYNLLIGKASLGPGTLTMTGGSLSSTNSSGTAGLAIGYETTGTFLMSGGSVYVGGQTRVGRYSTGQGILEITDGTFSTNTLRIGNETGSQGLVKLYGGIIETRASSSGLGFPNGSGELELKGTGVLTCFGNYVGTFNNLISSGNIYTNEEGKWPAPTYNSATDITTLALGVNTATTTTFNNHLGTGLWRQSRNWTAGVPDDSPSNENDYITLSNVNCVIDSNTAAKAGYVILGRTNYGDGQIVMTGGSLDATRIYLTVDASGCKASFKMSGGNVTVSEIFYVGRGEGLLEITGGVLTVNKLWVPDISTPTGYPNGYPGPGLVKLYGGRIAIQNNGVTGLQLATNSNSVGHIDIRGKGILTWVGNWTGAVNNYISSGLIYTSQAGATLEVGYQEAQNITYVALSGYVKTINGDVTKDGYVNSDDLQVMAENWLSWKATDPVNPNPVIFAPHTTAVTIDGDISDWQNSSDWAVFGNWYVDGAGLTSVNRAKYAWNADTDMLYIGLESTESRYIIIEVGGLMGDLSDPDATVEGSSHATQIQFVYNADTDSIIMENQVGGVITGVTAAHKWNNGTMTVEIATPIYGDWINGTGALSLSAGMDIYEYANIFDENMTGGDSQASDGVQTYYGNAKLMSVGSDIRLINSLPATCSDMPSGKGNLADIVGSNCMVNFADFAVLAEDWLTCNNVEDPSCL